MSRGQKPRRREFFPRMKRRGVGRVRRSRVTFYDSRWQAVWPQPSYGQLRFGDRVFNTATGYWETNL